MSSSTAQRQAVAQFRDMTGCSESTAQKYLKATRYDIELAVDTFLRKHSTPRVDTKQLDKIFSTYAEQGSDEIQIEGTIKYLEDLGLSLEETGVLGLAMQLEAPTQGIFSRSGFVKGWSSLGISNLPSMKLYASGLTKDLSPVASQYTPPFDPTGQARPNSEFFRKTYLYTFTFALTPPSRTLPLDSALVFWELLLTGRFPRLSQWIEFMTLKNRGVSRDVWNLVLDFSETVVSEDLADYDEFGAWPVVIDEFVEWCRSKQ